MDGLTIGKVARGAGLAIDTVRYYEREGLIEKPARIAAGYWHYAVARLRYLYDPAQTDEGRLVGAIEKGGYKVASTG